MTYIVALGHAMLCFTNFNISRLAAKEKLKKFMANIYTRPSANLSVLILRSVHFRPHIDKSLFWSFDPMIAILMWLKKTKSQQIAVS